MSASVCRGLRQAQMAQRTALPARCSARAQPIRRQLVTQRCAVKCRAASQDPTGAAHQGPLAAGTLVLAAAALTADLFVPGTSHALELHAEPGNALSLPTWAIHVSSVLEWVTAMGLMWKYAEASGNPRWKGMAWGMVPSLGSAMAACTWHLFYNSPDLEFLVVVQSALTVIGNCTCWWAAYRIYEAAVAEKSSA